MIGIAVYGAVAGSPTAHSGFLAGLHTAGLHTAGLFTVAAIGHLRRHPR